MVYQQTKQQNNNNKFVEVAQYKGETGKNGFERGKQHLKYLQKKDTKDSVLWLHSLHHHQGREDIKYSMSVTGIFKEPYRQTNHGESPDQQLPGRYFNEQEK